jgi:hypothetical protein
MVDGTVSFPRATAAPPRTRIFWTPVVSQRALGPGPGLPRPREQVQASFYWDPILEVPARSLQGVIQKKKKKKKKKNKGVQ